MLSEAEKTAVRAEAQEILKRFGKSLSAVKGTRSKKQSAGGYREEQEGAVCDDDFRTRLFANAPRKDDECLLMEKGSWQ